MLAIAAIAFQLLPAQLDGTAGADLAADYASARDLRQGRDPYFPRLPESIRRHAGEGPTGDFPNDLANPHPPTLIAVQVPLSRLPWRLLRTLWLIASAGSVAACCFVVARRVGFDRAISATAGIVALALPMTQDALFNGAVEPLLLAFFVAAWLALGRGKERRAGLLLGLVVALKLYPLFFAGAFIRRQRAALLWTLGTAVAAFALGSLVTSTSVLHAASVPGRNLDHYGSSTLNVGLPALIIQIGRGIGRSLPAWAPVVYFLGFAIGLGWLAWRKNDLLGAAPIIVFAPICWNSYFLYSLPALIRQARARVPMALIAVTTIALSLSWRLSIYDATINTVGPLLLMIGEMWRQNGSTDKGVAAPELGAH